VVQRGRDAVWPDELFKVEISGGKNFFSLETVLNDEHLKRIQWMNG
jgi:hypothetical protein